VRQAINFAAGEMLDSLAPGPRAATAHRWPCHRLPTPGIREWRVREIFNRPANFPTVIPRSGQRLMRVSPSRAAPTALSSRAGGGTLGDTSADVDAADVLSNRLIE
jgi:hypothetical protein